MPYLHICCKRALEFVASLRKETCKDKASYVCVYVCVCIKLYTSSPPCSEQVYTYSQVIFPQKSHKLFPQNNPIIHGCFAERDLCLQTFYAYSPPYRKQTFKKKKKCLPEVCSFLPSKETYNSNLWIHTHTHTHTHTLTHTHTHTHTQHRQIKSYLSPKRPITDK